MLNIDIKLLMEIVSIGLLFVLFITKAYTKSISTTIYIVSLVISLETYKNYSEKVAFVVIVLGAVIVLIRAIVNHKQDRLIKR